MSKIVFPAFLLFVIVLFSGCEKKQNNNNAGNSNSSSQVQNRRMVSESTRDATEKPKERLTIELQQKEEVKKHEEETQTRREPPGKEKLLFYLNTPPVFPEDVIIGKLQPAEGEDPAERQIWRTAHDFFRQLGKKNIPSDLFYPEWKISLQRTLSVELESGEVPETVRIGMISVEGDSAYAYVRLLRGKGRTDGEIYFRQEGGAWYISDVQFDLASLRKEYTRQSDFEPEVYRWLGRY